MKGTLSMQVPKTSLQFESITMTRRLLSSQSSNTGSTKNPAVFTHSSRESQPLPVRKLSSLPAVEEEVHHEHEGGENEFFTTTSNRTSSLHENVSLTSPRKSHLSYVDDTSFPITSELSIVKPNDDAPSGIWPVYRIMDEDGTFRTDNEYAYKHSSSYHHYNRNGPNTYEEVRNNAQKQNDIFALKNKLLRQFPNHAHAIRSSNLFQTNDDNMYKSYAETSSSIGESKISTQNDKNVTLLRAHRIMTRLREMDDILLNAQRQGRISFYLTCRGEEGIHIGSAAALTMDDVILAQYREQGILMWRGFTLDQFTNQCFTNDLDLGRGRQMPIHYGSRALNYHTISSPLGTQLPQAVGVAYKMKLDNLKHNQDQHKHGSISIAYFGDGAASTSDFHSSLNFAATLKVPMIFFCRNNGYAISTKITEQYVSDGIVCRSRAYGMAAIRIDGNDVLAVNAATRAAREYAIQHSEPVLIEAITYRQGHHSTSDDSYQYRSVDEVDKCENSFDPLKRFENFLIKQEWMDENTLAAIRDEERKAVLKALEAAEKRPLPKLETMFKDVYKDMPLNLLKQEESLQKHMTKYSKRQ